MVLPGEVEAFIAHYASENYDPKKAHEYYLRNRQLQGRDFSTKGFTKGQREGWSYAKSQVELKKRGNLKTARVGEKQSIEQARAQANAVRSDISAKLKAFSEQLTKQYAETTKAITEDSKNVRQTIADNLKTDIAAIPEVPKNLPKDQRAKLQAERSDKIQALRGKASVDLQDLNKSVVDVRLSERSSTKQDRQSNSDAASAERTKVANDLQQVVAKYRDQYTSANAQIKSESKATLGKEFQNIKTKVR